jgi:DNA-directed RNA polymerase sigma subunit (sigma70/sigma32)
MYLMINDQQQFDAWVFELYQGNRNISREREYELIYQYQNGNAEERQAALDELVSYNVLPILSLALRVYHAYPNAKNTYLSLKDYVLTGIVAFIAKLDTFDITKGYRLITYYSRDVLTHMQRLVMRYGDAVPRGSVYLQMIAGRLARIFDGLISDNGDEPHIGELSEQLGVSESTVQMVYDHIYGYRQISLNTPEFEPEVEIPTAEVADSINEDYMRFMSIVRSKLHFLSNDQYQHTIRSMKMEQDIPEEIVQLIKLHRSPYLD